VGRNWQEIAAKCCLWVFNIYQGILNMPRSLTTWGRQHYFPSKEVMLRLFMSLKTPWTQGSVTSTITITPPRTTSLGLTSVV
jgi:hypothetical protein